MSLDVRDYWNFDDPAGSEVAFKDLIEKGELNAEEELEVVAQIARTFGLRGDFSQSHLLLDQRWDEAMRAGGRPKASFELERGRAFRSGKEVDKCLSFFESAAQSEIDDLKVDALHMLALVSDPDEAIRINQEAIAFANASPSPWAQRWVGTLSNNLAWSLFDLGRLEEAHAFFLQAYESRVKFKQTGAARIAQWCLARCKREMGNLDDALNIQLELAKSKVDGYVAEELGELYLAKGDADTAKPYFAKAVELLSDELGADSERIVRMKSLA